MARHAITYALLALSSIGFAHSSHGHRHSPSHHSRNIARNTNESIDSDISTPSALFRRDDYTCAPGRPCKNGACCGASGNCGYGPVYCGTGCSSNCDATAECGKFSKVPGKTCPLNTCCSEFGFCGTTTDFCGKNCQSNCVEHPKPPGGDGGKVTNRVIGYWEAWNARSECHNTQADDLPLEALTHVNYAFAYIDPTSFEITTMDAQTPASTFQDAVSLKDLKPDLKVFVSIGGWTFSDNDTATQPVFGNIARSESNRQKFADNLLRFMNGYGFDGVDLDWEYPGAPDRGGKEDDAKNYVELLKTLRTSFDNSGRELGLTFTAPSSFWYLRWFDLPNMMKYADWVNLMSYDLHGVWDSSNPIGSVVQAHTNLTEIKLAAELFWRVDIPPSKIALGFGFYGRAFTLADPSCNKPGCAFSGGAKKGPCTGTSGYLAYYEIQDILKKNQKRDLTVIHDKEAAVKYLSWDNDQWISYDDADTFKQKRDWADSVGFSGSLIWASDLDDYDNTAHKAFTGNPDIGSRNSLRKSNYKQEFTDTASSFLGEGCEFHQTIVKDVKSFDCGTDKELVGYDTHGCSGDKKHPDWQCGWPMCCPKSARMKDKCMWRGSGGDCNGQCHANEVKIGGSSWGGYPGEGKTGKCSRGGKQLCCAVEVEAVTDGCYWTTGCDNKQCKSDEESVAHAYNINPDVNKCVDEEPPLKRREAELAGLLPRFSRANSGGQNYCCKKTKKAFDTCKWVGSGDCASNTCGRDEVTLATDDYGDSDYPCNWWRKRALCCKPNKDALNDPVCDADICGTNGINCDDPDSYDSSLDQRSLSLSVPSDFHHLAKRVERRQSVIILKNAVNLVITRAPYPSQAGKIFLGDGTSTLPIKGGFMMADNICKNLGVSFISQNSIPKQLLSYAGKAMRWNTEHYREGFTMGKILEAATTGELLSGKKMVSKVMDPQVIVDAWNSAYPAGATLYNLGEVAVTGVKGFGKLDNYGFDWNKLTTPNMRFFTVIGSYSYRYSLSYLPSDMNIIKSTLLRGLKNPIAKTVFDAQLALAAGADTKEAIEAAKFILTSLQRTYGAVSYYNDAYLAHYFDKARRDMYALADEMARLFPGWEEFPKIMKEWDADQHALASENAQTFMASRTADVLDRFTKIDLATAPEHIRQLINGAKKMASETDKLKFDTSGV